MEAATGTKAGTGRVACSATANQQRYCFNCTNSKRIVPQPCSCQTTFSEGIDMHCCPYKQQHLSFSIWQHSLVRKLGKNQIHHSQTGFQYQKFGCVAHSSRFNHSKSLFGSFQLCNCSALYSFVSCNRHNCI